MTDTCDGGDVLLLGRRSDCIRVALLTAVNFVSVGVAVASLRIWPPDYG